MIRSRVLPSSCDDVSLRHRVANVCVRAGGCERQHKFIAVTVHDSIQTKKKNRNLIITERQPKFLPNIVDVPARQSRMTVYIRICGEQLASNNTVNDINIK